METFSFNPPLNLSKEGTWLSAVTSLEAINSVFNITHEELFNFNSKLLDSRSK